MYGFLASFCMHSTCMWFLSYELSWHGGFLGLTVVLHSLSISWITMALWVPFFRFLVGSQVPLVAG